MAKASEELRALRAQFAELQETMSEVLEFVRGTYRIAAWKDSKKAKEAGVLPDDHPKSR